MINRFRRTALGALLTAILSFSIIGQFTVGTALLTATPAAIVITSVACSKDQLVASAQDILDVVTDQSVIAALQTVAPASVARLAAIVPAARQLVAAIKAGDFSNALASVNAIFPIVDLIANDLHANPKMLGLIGLANIGIHFIINHVKAQLPSHAAVTPEMQVAIDYASQPAWGCDYHKKDKRCQ